MNIPELVYRPVQKKDTSVPEENVPLEIWFLSSLLDGCLRQGLCRLTRCEAALTQAAI